MFFNGIAYFFEQIYSQLNTTEADYCPYGLFSQPHLLCRLDIFVVCRLDAV